MKSIRIRLSLFVFVLGFGLSTAHAQGIMSDMMSGALITPEVGVFAWYELTDSTTQRGFYLRQAIVDSEKVKRKEAFWLETELVPKVGFPSVYKMLLTGPARDPENVHRLIVREGKGLVQEVEVDRSQKAAEEDEGTRTSVGMEKVVYAGGEIDAEHFIIEDAQGKTELWVSDQVRPMGLVRMKTSQGELILQRFGVGGRDGETALPGLKDGNESADEKRESDQDKSKRPRTNFGGRRR